MVAVLCLRPETQVSTDSLLVDLKAIVAYPIESDQVIRNLHHMRRMGLVEVDWRKGVIIRNPSMKEYVAKLIKSDLWPRVADDWQRIGFLIESKYGQINPEFQQLLPSKGGEQNRKVS
jgi:hypothetical protein